MYETNPVKRRVATAATLLALGGIAGCGNQPNTEVAPQVHTKSTPTNPAKPRFPSFPAQIAHTIYGDGKRIDTYEGKGFIDATAQHVCDGGDLVWERTMVIRTGSRDPKTGNIPRASKITIDIEKDSPVCEDGVVTAEDYTSQSRPLPPATPSPESQEGLEA